jgi:peroxiredoxin
MICEAPRLQVQLALVASTLLLACASSRAPAPLARTASDAPIGASPAPVTAAPAKELAAVGEPAPDFALKDLDGNEVRLSSFKGKTVVLEWFNPECPFVELSHTKGSLKGAAKRHAREGVVWLAINSGAPGRNGYGADANRAAAKRYGMEHPILLDETGQVGKRYGATNTPHMFVVDEAGTLVYRGAVDNSPDGEGESPSGGELVSYVEEALAAAKNGEAPRTAETKAYGCGVKYAK